MIREDLSVRPAALHTGQARVRIRVRSLSFRLTFQEAAEPSNYEVSRTGVLTRRSEVSREHSEVLFERSGALPEHSVLLSELSGVLAKRSGVME